MDIGGRLWYIRFLVILARLNPPSQLACTAAEFNATLDGILDIFVRMHLEDGGFSRGSQGRNMKVPPIFDIFCIFCL